MSSEILKKPLCRKCYYLRSTDGIFIPPYCGHYGITIQRDMWAQKSCLDFKKRREEKI
jgi:hypothetical protein